DTDDIDPSIELIELPALEPDTDRPASHPHREQLPTGDHSVLLPRQLGHLPIKKSSVQLTLYMRANCTFAVDSADAEAMERACGARIVPIHAREAHEK